MTAPAPRVVWAPNILIQPSNPEPYFDELFTDATLVSRIFSRIDVFRTYSTSVIGLDPSNAVHYDPGWEPFWQRVIPVLQEHHVAHALEMAGPRGYAPGLTICADGPLLNGKLSAEFDISQMVRLEALGHTIDLITMDGGLRRTILNGQFQDLGCNMSVRDSAAAVVRYMQTIHDGRPDIRIGLMDNTLVVPFDGVPGYASVLYPDEQRPDFRDQFEELTSQVDAAGEKLDHYHDDGAVENALSLVSSTYQFADDWMDKIFRLGTMVRAAGVRFGTSFNSNWGARGDLGMGASDAYYQDQVLLYVAEWLIHRASDQPAWGDLDDIEFETFAPPATGSDYYPQLILDDASPQTGLIVADSLVDTVLKGRALYGPRQVTRARRGRARRIA